MFSFDLNKQNVIPFLSLERSSLKNNNNKSVFLFAIQLNAQCSIGKPANEYVEALDMSLEMKSLQMNPMREIMDCLYDHVY